MDLRPPSSSRRCPQRRPAMQGQYLHYLRASGVAGPRHPRCAPRAAPGWTGPRRTPARPDVDAVHQEHPSGLLSHTSGSGTRPAATISAPAACASPSPRLRALPHEGHYVMAGELVETSRLWGRQAAAIDPRWAGSSAPISSRGLLRAALVSRQASAVATERVTLFGVPLVVARTVTYGRIARGVPRPVHPARPSSRATGPPGTGSSMTTPPSWPGSASSRPRRRAGATSSSTTRPWPVLRQADPAEVVSGRFDTWWKRAGRATPSC